MSEEKPRYSRLSDIIELAVYMQSRPLGVTIQNIQERYKVSRRTAERMRDSLMCIFPQVDEIETDDLQKHWGFTNFTMSSLVSFTPKEIVNIEQLQRRTTNKELKAELNKTIEKIKALSRTNIINVETNIELFMQTEGYAIRQMPEYKIDLNTLDVIRRALQNSQMVKGIYHEKERYLEPLGLVYGAKIYLVAREKAKGKEIYNYLLHKFSNLELLDDTFDKKGFNLQSYTNESFGVYHGEILDVKLLFSKELASEAEKYNFHPTQKFNKLPDGNLEVSFRASGDREIMWHIFKWGAECKILEPQSLIVSYKQYLQESLDNY